MQFSEYGHNSHVGRVRVHNEDCYVVDMENGFCVLADGMGGHEGGEVASQIVVDSISKSIRTGMALAEALVASHYAVLEAATNGQGRPGMGSTAVALKMDGEKFEIVWVGDSRAYLWDGAELTQLTKDHSLVQKMVDEGAITAEEAMVHPQRNFVTQAIGMSDLHSMEVGRIRGHHAPERQYLLCSDGLSSEVSSAEMEEILRQDLDAQQKIEMLVQKALDNGGSDNITAILITT
jgi:serine/threonine protein phosphatase PrpC